jgi:uncharacterized caspase-like protein
VSGSSVDQVKECKFTTDRSTHDDPAVGQALPELAATAVTRIMSDAMRTDAPPTDQSGRDFLTTVCLGFPAERDRALVFQAAYTGDPSPPSTS